MENTGEEKLPTLSTDTHLGFPDDQGGENNLDTLGTENTHEIIEALDLEEKDALARVDLSDRQLRMFRELKEGDKPVIAIPREYPLSIHYPQFMEPRCAICTSPFRELAEHVYINNGKKPQAVLNFFETYFNAKLNWVQVKTHMEQHCNLRNIATKGLDTYRGREEEVAEWLGREFYLVELALLVELDDIRGMDCSKNPELKLKRASMVERLTTRLKELKKERDESLMSSFNIFEILMDLHNSMESEADKKLIREKVAELRDRLQENM
jgi:hypothetical protein